MRWFNTRLRTRENTVSESARVLDQLKGAKAAALHYGEQSKRLEAERDAALAEVARLTDRWNRIVLPMSMTQQELEQAKIHRAEAEAENLKLKQELARQNNDVVKELKADLARVTAAWHAAEDMNDGCRAILNPGGVAIGTGG